MANSIEIIIKAVDQASGVINKITTANTSSAKSMLAMVGGYAAIGAAAYKAEQYIEDSIESTVAYGKTVRDMMRITGDSAEETSKLIQVTDDLMITQEELATAMRGAVMKGVDTSIAGMASLSEQYLKLNVGLERSQFLTENFGRSGLKMGLLMEQGAQGIYSMADAIDESLIMTDEAIQEARNYEIAVDELNDTFQGFKYTLGKELIPVAIELTEVLTNLFSEMDDDAPDGYARMMGTAATISEEAEATIRRELADSNEAWDEHRLMVSNSVNQMSDDVTLASEEMGRAHEKEAQDIITATQKIIAANEEERRQMLLNIATQGLDAQSKYEVLYAMGEIDAATYSLLTSLSEQREAFERGEISAMDLAIAVGNYEQSLDDLDGKVAHTKILLEIQTSGREDMINLMRGNGYAKGGSFVVPPGYPNDSYGIGLTSGERVVVTPPGEKSYEGASSSGGVTVVLNYSPVVSMADRYEAETKLLPYIESALRKIR